MLPSVLDGEKLSGPEKAAIFLLIMGKEYTSEILKKIGEDEIRILTATMAKIKSVPPEVMKRVMEEFIANVEDNDRLMIEGETFLKSVMESSLAREKVSLISSELEKNRKNVPFSCLEGMDTRTLAGFLKGEHPQVVALILAHLRPKRAAEILSELPDEMQADVAVRIVEINQVPAETIDELDRTIAKEFGDLGDSRISRRIGGVSALADILNEVDRTTEQNVLSSIEEEKADLAEEVRQMMFIFEDLVKVDDRSMREILKQVEMQQLTVALKTASEEMKEKIFSNLSERAGSMLREDMEVMGPVRLAEVEQAQQNIIKAARQLEAEGKIVLAKGKEDVLV
ncbi:MAG: flagellar motor switch protein FliG [Deltaproteobacteria bacterium]|nr:flagellar motor switch protein FliG [Deltaproteobacteria bacterium]